MRQIRILTPGRTKADFIVAGNREYLKRLKHFTQIELITLPAVKIPPRPSDADIVAIRALEAQTILKALKYGEYLIALTEDGQQFTSPQLAAHLQRLSNQGHNRLAFAIGGTLGLAPEVRQRAHMLLSLSSLTFTHELARLILLEQLYRAFKINAGHPYHY